MCSAVVWERQLRFSCDGTQRNKNEFDYVHYLCDKCHHKKRSDARIPAQGGVELLPLYHDLPGFVGYSVARIDDVSAICWSLWQTYDQAKQSITADDLITVGFGAQIDGIQSLVGEMPFSVFTGERAIGTSAKAPTNGSTAPVAGRTN